MLSVSPSFLNTTIWAARFAQMFFLEIYEHRTNAFGVPFVRIFYSISFRDFFYLFLLKSVLSCDMILFRSRKTFRYYRRRYTYTYFSCLNFVAPGVTFCVATYDRLNSKHSVTRVFQRKNILNCYSNFR